MISVMVMAVAPVVFATVAEDLGDVMATDRLLRASELWETRE